MPSAVPSPEPGCKKRSQEHVFGGLHRAHDPVAVQLQFAPVRIGQPVERPPGRGIRDELRAGPGLFRYQAEGEMWWAHLKS
jgi:hypothetical protein